MIGLSQLAVSAPLSYPAAFWIPALDAALPILPSEMVPAYASSRSDMNSHASPRTTTSAAM